MANQKKKKQKIVVFIHIEDITITFNASFTFYSYRKTARGNE